MCNKSIYSESGVLSCYLSYEGGGFYLVVYRWRFECYMAEHYGKPVGKMRAQYTDSWVCIGCFLG